MIYGFYKIVFLVGLLAGFASAQNPVSWTLSAGQLQGKSYSFKLTAEIDSGWHLYALDQPAGGPIATTIQSGEPSQFVVDGKIDAPRPISKIDPLFPDSSGRGLETRYYEGVVIFKIPVKSVTESHIAQAEYVFNVRYQLCNDTFCLPPKTVRVSPGYTEDMKTASGNQSLTAGESPAPQSRIDKRQQPTNFWSFVWLALTFGAISLLTPCVFPMIPITVSYFMKHAHGDRAKTMRLATVYSVGIIATFSLLGMLLAVTLGAAGITLFAANPWVNLLIAAIFILFAFNLFGFYEISIPSSVLSKLDKLTRAEEGKGSEYIGALLMGLTFTLTSFTCTSPFIGTILVSTAQGNWKMPLLGMLVFSTVFALPFFALATVPRFLHSLPRSGGWLNSVKVVMGFLEVAAAVKFLSNVDLVWGAAFAGSGSAFYGWAFTRESVLFVWVAIGLAICLYILGFFRFRHDSPVTRLSPLRLVFAGAFFALCIYLTFGILGRKLGELESFLPPKNAESRFNVLGNKEEEARWLVNNFDEARRQAKAEKKPIFIDFTGYTCTNCRWMEANMFPLSEVKREMDEFVLVRLYTDGEGSIYERQQLMEQEMFGTVALPFYAVLDGEGKPIATFPGLTRSPTEFVDFLKKAKQN